MIATFLLALVVDLAVQIDCKDPLWSKISWKSGSSVTSGWGKIISGPSLPENAKIVRDPAGGGQNVLRVHYKKGSYRFSTSEVKKGNIPPGGFQFAATLGGKFRPADELTLTFEVYFDKNFDFVKGGKLPGFYGGDDTCTGGDDADDKRCFSTRFMWREDGDAELYLYLPKDQRSNFCSKKDFIICNWDRGHSAGRRKPGLRFQTKEDGVGWQKITQYIKLNTPGKKDGKAKIWFRNKKLYDVDGLNFRGKDSGIHINGILFSTFFGGGDKTYAAKKDTYAYFRHFAVFDKFAGTMPAPLG